jgi:putative redox protein
MASVSVRSVGAGYSTRIEADGHILVADEPAPFGDDLGPSPYDLLLAALGSCTSMTLLQVARRRGWPLQHVEIELSHDRVYADDRSRAEQEGGRVEAIRRTIRLVGDLGEQERSVLARIAGRCPLQKTLLSTPAIIDDFV